MDTDLGARRRHIWFHVCTHKYLSSLKCTIKHTMGAVRTMIAAVVVCPVAGDGALGVAARRDGGGRQQRAQLHADGSLGAGGETAQPPRDDASGGCSRV